MSAVAGRVERPSLIAGFTFENGGEQLAAAFSRVEAHELRGGVAVPEVGPLVAYIDSLRAPLAWLLPDADMWPAVLEEAGRTAAEVIARDGVFRAQTHVGVFICGCRSSVEQVEQLLRGAGDHGAVAADHDGPLDEVGVLDHGCDHRVAAACRPGRAPR